MCVKKERTGGQTERVKETERKREDGEKVEGEEGERKEERLTFLVGLSQMRSSRSYLCSRWKARNRDALERQAVRVSETRRG